MIRSLTIIAVTAVALAACTPQVPDIRGAGFYAKHCTSCHGRSAQGDGPLAAQYGTPPTNLTLLSQRNGGTFPTEEVMAQVNGYTGRHQLNGMPEFGQDLDGPTVDWVSETGQIIPTPKALLDLTSYLESIQE